jgi:hypothetical protein
MALVDFLSTSAFNVAEIPATRAPPTTTAAPMGTTPDLGQILKFWNCLRKNRRFLLKMQPMMLKNKKIKKVLTIFQENRRFAENG